MLVKKRILTLAEKQGMIEAGSAKREERKQQRRKAEQGIIDIYQKRRVGKVFRLRTGESATKANVLFENKTAAELLYFRRNRFVQRGQTKARRREIESQWRKFEQAKKAKSK